MAEEHCNISMFSEAIFQSTNMTKNIGGQDAKDNMSCKVFIRVGFPEKKMVIGRTAVCVLAAFGKDCLSPDCRNQSLTGAQLKESNYILQKPLKITMTNPPIFTVHTNLQIF